MKLAILFPAALCAPSALAQTPVPLVLEGDVVPGIGNVTSISNIAILNERQWLVELDTDNADSNIDGAILDANGVRFREGQALPAPVGATLDSFDSIRFEPFGKVGYNFFLDGTSGTSDDSGIYVGDALLLQESEFSTDPSLTAGTPYIGFFDVKCATPVGGAMHLMSIASVDDVAIASTVDRVLVQFVTDASGTSLASETVLWKEGDILPGQTEAIADFGTGPHNSAYGGPGLEMFFADLTGDTATDGTIWLGSTLLAQEGSPSPVPGRNWSSLSSPEMDVNTSGDWVFSGSLDGDTATNLVIVKNGTVIVQEGDTPPGIGAFAFTSFGSGPLSLAETGDLLWYGDWDDPDTTIDTGLFLNGNLLVQEGVTAIAGSVVDTLRGVQDGYFISPDGQHVIFEAILADGREGAFLIEVGLGTNYCVGGVGAQLGLESTMSASGSTSLSDNSLKLIANPVPVQPGVFYFGTTSIQVPFGNGFRCAGGTATRLPVIVPNTGTAELNVDVNAAGLVPGTRYFQYWFRDVGSLPSTFNLTDGLEITFVP